jgi:hypothetical protein
VGSRCHADQTGIWYPETVTHRAFEGPETYNGKSDAVVTLGAAQCHSLGKLYRFAGSVARRVGDNTKTYEIN